MTAIVKSRFPEVIATLGPRLSAALGAGAEIIAEEAAERVSDQPVIGEGLVSAIHVEKTGELEFAVVGGDDEHWYGHFLEFGTSHSAPRPFLVPALDAKRDNVVELAAVALRGL